MQHLSEVVDFEVLLARDETLEAREGAAALLVRDRALAEQLPSADPHERLRAWVVRRRRTEADLPGDRAKGLLALVGWLLGIVGVSVGIGAATALLAYDGRSPINVLAWLLYTAAIPFLLALVLVAGLVIPSRWLPRAGPVQALLGAVIEPLLRRLPNGRGWARQIFGRAGRGTGRLQRWLLVTLTQVFALAFSCAAVATLLVKVAITDLTFSWSTTLELSDDQVSALVSGIATPWASVWPEAVPGAEAVARSNYRRFVERFRDTPKRTPVDVAVGALWWKWSAMAIGVYGVLPRVILLLLAIIARRRAVRRWPSLERPEVQGLLARFEDTGGTFAPRRLPSDAVVAPLDETPSPPFEAPPAFPAELVAAPVLAVAWGAAAAEPIEAARALARAPEEVLGAGADLDLGAERAVLAAAAKLEGPVAVLVPRSEPPIEDLLAFLRELRAIAPRVSVIPLSKDASGWRQVPPDEAWARALARVKGVEAPAE